MTADLLNVDGFTKEVKDFFKPACKRSELDRNIGSCISREVCLISGVAITPAFCLVKTSLYAYVTVRSIIVAVCQIFRLLACRKDACKKLGESVWLAVDSVSALAVVLLSTVYKIIQCLLGALLHPSIAVKCSKK